MELSSTATTSRWMTKWEYVLSLPLWQRCSTKTKSSPKGLLNRRHIFKIEQETTKPIKTTAMTYILLQDSDLSLLIARRTDANSWD